MSAKSPGRGNDLSVSSTMFIILSFSRARELASLFLTVVTGSSRNSAISFCEYPLM